MAQLKLEYGKMEKEYNGLKREMMQQQLKNNNKKNEIKKLIKVCCKEFEICECNLIEPMQPCKIFSLLKRELFPFKVVLLIACLFSWLSLIFACIFTYYL